MKRELLNYLRCPECRTSLSLTTTEEERGEVKEGSLRCDSGLHAFAIKGFVPRFVDAERYADSFSRQRLYVRKHFRHYEKDRSGDVQFFPTTGFTREGIASGITLEVGCGYGRFLDVVQRAGGRIIGVDLSTHSIELARDFVGFREGVFLVQADLFKLPFEVGSFDHVFSIGVLHHTPDTAEAVRAVAPFVRRGGRMAVWVYHPGKKRTANWWRQWTARLDHRVLYGLCIANQAAFSWVRALPGGWRLNSVLPGATPAPGRPFWMRVLSDFDNLSPTYAHVHAEHEVESWFCDLGFDEVQVLPRLTSVTGRRA
jgi:SAM-dependent methyltransferase